MKVSRVAISVDALLKHQTFLSESRLRSWVSYCVTLLPSHTRCERYRLSFLAGVPVEQQDLVCGGRQLHKGPLLPQTPAGSTVSPLCRLLGGNATVSITLQPRVQKDKWSLYWKESMATKTEAFDTIALEADIDTKVSTLQQV